MTSSARSIFDVCEGVGFHLTLNRRRILAVFDETPAPLGAKAVQHRLAVIGFRASEAAIARVLREAEKRGAVRAVASSDGRPTYATGVIVPFDLEVVDARDGTRLCLDDPSLLFHIEQALEQRGWRLSGPIRFAVTPRDHKA